MAFPPGEFNLVTKLCPCEFGRSSLLSSTMQAALRYQHSTDRRARQIADEMDRHITKQGNSNHDDEDGSSGVLVPVG